VAIIDRVKWDGSPDVLAWKYPSEELSTWTQLIVNESQEAFLVRGGVYEGPFGAGRHTLSTENIPLLRELMGLPFGGASPFSAEVWFVDKLTRLDIRWGTPDPIQLQDPKFGIMVPVRAFGQYGIRVDDAKRFLLKLVGTLPAFDTDTLSDYLRGLLTTRIKTNIANAILGSGLSVLEIAPRLDALSDALEASLAADIAEYGIAVTQFNIHSINMPEDDPAVETLKAALAKRAEMSIVGFDYQQQRRFDVMETAAANEGSAGVLMSAGLGAGAGIGLAPAMGQAFAQAAQPMQAAPAIAPAERIRLLKDLAELRAQGVLTDAEFDNEKRRILAS
jgi:membrane protease subunit (stomatin/prohibitin family)